MGSDLLCGNAIGGAINDEAASAQTDALLAGFQSVQVNNYPHLQSAAIQMQYQNQAVFNGNLSAQNTTSWHGIQNAYLPILKIGQFTVCVSRHVERPPMRPCPTCGSYKTAHIRTDKCYDGLKAVFVQVYQCRDQKCSTDFVHRDFTRNEDVEIILKEIQMRVENFKLV